VSPVRYDQPFYIPEDDILHSHCREYIKIIHENLYIGPLKTVIVLRSPGL
jgi:hypothetical protein